LRSDEPARIIADMKEAVKLLPENKQLFAADDEHDIRTVKKRPEVIVMLAWVHNT
jgi:hypothetical protein